MKVGAAAMQARVFLFAVLTILSFAAVLVAAMAHLTLGALALCAVAGVLAVTLAGRFLIGDGIASIRGLTERGYNVVESIPDGFFIIDKDWRFSHVNERAEELLRKGAGELIGVRVQDVLDPLASDLVPEMLSVRRQSLPLERLQHFQSTDRWIEIRIQPAHEELLVHLRDVTERKKSELLLKTTASLRLLLSQMPAVVWTVDRELRLTSVRGAAMADKSLFTEDLIGAPYGASIDDPEQRRVCLAELRRALEGDAVRYEVHQNGRWLQNDVEPLRDAEGAVIGAIGVMLDVTDVRESAERFARLARLDVMTQLPNRLALEESLPAILENAAARQGPVAVLFIDIDRFKTINDTLGHRAGDKLLRAIAGRLQERLVHHASIYRPSGDEFVVVIEGISDKRAILAVATGVLAGFHEPFIVDGRELFVTASIGTSFFPENAQAADDLVAFADSAMYRAKEAGRNNVKSYDGTMHARVLERLGLEQDLRHALVRKELSLTFQPIVDARTKRIVTAEALLRWRHPGLGELLPEIFIPIAEESGIIVEISRWVLTEACTMAMRIRQSIAPDFRVSVNLSPRDFYEQDCAAMISEVLTETGLPASALELEVTENVVLNDLAVATLLRIHAMGVQVVVDDFGTGYSSLNYIKRLPVHAIKIDKSFIEDVTRDPYDQGIVKAIATLAQTLGLRVIAEGVETEAQWEFVRSLQCDQAQGFLFHRPLRGQELLACVSQEAQPPSSAPRVVPLYRPS
ncbi:MAG TPA: EAL domain-containing protein [Candidatus Rubrimentiphilum sp.]|nr:EAL domain-containing protein [Candidatus Rubrimentiphilum sp.]